MFEIKNKHAVLLLIAVLSFGAVGCGGDDGSDEPSEPAPTATTDTATSITKAELISDGDDICAEVNAAVGTISSSSTADEAIKETQISDIYSGLAERLDGLGTPSDGEAPTAVIAAAQDLAESTSADGATTLSAFQTAATDYGFTECGEAPAAPSSSTVTPPSDSGSSAPAVPVEPAPAPVPVEPAPAPTEPPAAGGGVVPDTPAPPSDSGGGSSSGGITPG